MGFEWIADPQAWVALLTLTALEIVLGIDNIIFISILVGRLPPERRQSARLIGLSLAMLTRIALLLSLTWIMSLTRPLFSVAGWEVSGRDLVLVGGGLFLLVKATLEIHTAMEGVEEIPNTAPWRVFPPCWRRSPSSISCSPWTRSLPRSAWCSWCR